MLKKKEILFIIIGASLLLITVSLVVYSINFLMENAGAALNQDSADAKEIIRFNLEGLKSLGIVKE